MGDLISVILPVYNGESYLEDSIQSILNQTYQNFELIIINDGSTDNSDKIIKGFLKSNKILYISRENKGLAQTLNDCIVLCSGDYIARMDQDDICYSNRLEKQLTFMLENKLDVCGTSYEIINKNSKKIKVVNSFNENFEIILSAMLVPFAHPCVMFRNIFKSLNLKYGNVNKTYAEDYDLWIKMYEKNLKFGNLNEILFKYRMYEFSLSKTSKHEIFCEIYENCKNFNIKNQKKLLNSYIKINTKKLNIISSQILVRSILNFLRFNGYNSIAIKLFLKINFQAVFLGWLKFLKQETKFSLKKYKI